VRSRSKGNYQEVNAMVRGFTLIEMMITIAILGILTMLSAPGFAKFIAQRQLDTEATTLYTHILFARYTAVDGQFDVTICPSSTGTSCSTDWRDGWIVFEDHDSDSTVSAGDVILRVQRDALRSTLNVTIGTALRFAKMGQVSPATAGQFSFCAIKTGGTPVKFVTDVTARGVSISTTGGASRVLPTAANCTGAT
jgi:type IV fimbrial biogenesis protein FimT